MSQASSIGAGLPAVTERPSRRSGRVRHPVRREVETPKEPVDYAHLEPKKLLAKFWDFAKRDMSKVAAAMVSLVGVAGLAGQVSGELADTVQEAANLHKARGRSMAPEAVSTDLEILIPAGFTPNFDLYLQAVGIRPDTDADRRTAGAIKTAIRRKLADVRAGP